MKQDDIEFYAMIALFLFTVWFIINTIRYYYGEKRKIRHLHRFAKEGERDAQYTLAKRYQKGDMVKKSCQNAAFWYQKAALSGDEDAKSHLQMFLERHSHGDKDKC